MRTGLEVIGWSAAIIALALALDMPGQPSAQERLDAAKASCRQDGFAERDCENALNETN
jgi:hypothetical protein